MAKKGWISLVMGLDQRYHRSTGRQKPRGAGKDVPLAGPTDVDSDQFHQLREANVHCIGSLHYHDAGVVAELPIEYPISGINGENPGSAALQQAIGEPAGAASQIGADFSGHVDGEYREGVIQF